ncbi:MAG TPA: phosphoribosyl-ATP diphosphatase [Candidatus Mcinerneyibacteriales bacterium]|nr:phosphoribosyl-ATP diphosphatase [Candidatus Mcinerneyibacteriales bacterium]
MLIPSIDLSRGRIVQLEQGERMKIERRDIDVVINRLSLLGPLAVIDIDAAKEEGDNRELIKTIARANEIRAGGGIRTPEEARKLLSLGAEKVIIGSALFPEGTFSPEMLEKFRRAVGRERIIAALDTRDGRIVAKGWRKATKESPDEKLLTQLEKGAWGILATSVEREGMMQGPDIKGIERLLQKTALPVTAAGGITSVRDIRTISSMGAHVQVGMALYTGKLPAEEAFTAALTYDEKGLIPVIAENEDGEILMMAWANDDSLRTSLESGFLSFYSRSRQRLWTKGESSGNTLSLMAFRPDCDSDTLRAVVRPAGPVCHTGEESCFGSLPFSLEKLYDTIEERFKNPSPGSYTATLTDTLVREKIMEEAGELVEGTDRDNKVWEAADLLYFVTVLLQKEGISFKEVLAELRRRRWRLRCSQ